MPTLNINGSSVSVDDSFLKLSPDQQNATVDEIAKSIPKGLASAVNSQGKGVAPTSDAPPIGSEIGSGVMDALKSAGTSVGDYLNPFSEARHASYAKQAAAPLGEALTENLRQIGGTGSALATPVTAPGNAIGAVTVPLLAHPWQAVNKTLGIDLPYDQAKEQAGTALMGLAPKGYSPIGGKSILAPLPDAAALKTSAKAVYNDPGIKSIPIAPNDVGNLSTTITSDLIRQGFRPTPGSAPGTMAELDRMVPPQGVSSVNVDDIRAARRAFQITAKATDAKGVPTPDATAATQAIRTIDSYLDTVAPELRTANANYAAAKQADTVDYRQIMANRRRQKTGSGTNIENTMRQEVDKIPERGLTSEERDLRNQIVEGTTTRNALRRVGKLGFGDGLSLTQQLIATPLTGGANLPIGVAATAARKVGEALTRSQINQLSKMIRERSPLAQNRPMVQPPPPGMSRVAAALLLRQGLPGFAGAMPAYADQNQ